MHHYKENTPPTAKSLLFNQFAYIWKIDAFPVGTSIIFLVYTCYSTADMNKLIITILCCYRDNHYTSTECCYCF